MRCNRQTEIRTDRHEIDSTVDAVDVYCVYYFIASEVTPKVDYWANDI